MICESSWTLHILWASLTLNPSPSPTPHYGRCTAVTRQLHRLSPPNPDHVPLPLDLRLHSLSNQSSHKIWKWHSFCNCMFAPKKEWNSGYIQPPIVLQWALYVLYYSYHLILALMVRYISKHVLRLNLIFQWYSALNVLTIVYREVEDSVFWIHIGIRGYKCVRQLERGVSSHFPYPEWAKRRKEETLYPSGVAII